MTGDGSHPTRGVLASEAVARRLQELRVISTVERDEDARRRLARERPERRGTFATGIERRLQELRALCGLAEYLHRARRSR